MTSQMLNRLKEKEDEMKDLNEKMSGLSSEVEELKSKNNVS